MAENPLPDLDGSWKVIRRATDVLYEAVDEAVQQLIDEFNLPDDDDSIDALTDRVYELVVGGKTP